MNYALLHALQKHRIVSFRYDGLIRIVGPHTYGITIARHEAWSGYQIGGFSRSMNPPSWRLYLLSDMRNLIVTDAMFGDVRLDYNSDDLHFR